MNVQLYVNLALITWAYFCFASVTQQHAMVEYFDDRYIISARAFTSRRGRGDVYLTNVTIVSRVQFNNNITVKVVADIKRVGSIVFHETKLCDGLKIPWAHEIMKIYSNFTDCPILAGTYQVTNLEVPPKRFPLPVPKGEGTLHYYAYLTKDQHLVFHGFMKIVSS